MEQQLTVALFDDHPTVQHALAPLFERAGVRMLFQALRPEELHDALRTQRPTVVVMDVIAKGVNGFGLFHEVLHAHPTLRIVAHTSLGDAKMVEHLLTMGVLGYVCKTQHPGDLVSTVLEVAAGAISVPQDYRFLLQPSDIRDSTSLSAREQEVLTHVGAGRSSKEIADVLSISVNTVENHRRHLFEKLKVKNSADLVREGMSIGYLSVE